MRRYTLSYYLNFTRRVNERKALVEFRIANHKLMIEIGKCDQTPGDNRLCPTCGSNQIQDEIHVLFHISR